MVLYYILLPLAWIVFHVGFRVRAEGRDNLKKIRTRGYILAPNHISAIDPVFVIITRFWGRRMIVFAKKELFEINAFLSWFFRCAGAMCVRGTKAVSYTHLDVYKRQAVDDQFGFVEAELSALVQQALVHITGDDLRQKQIMAAQRDDLRHLALKIQRAFL